MMFLWYLSILVVLVSADSAVEIQEQVNELQQELRSLRQHVAKLEAENNVEKPEISKWSPNISQELNDNLMTLNTTTDTETNPL